MKKILLAMAFLFGCTTVSFAQTTFIATLQHEGEFTHYYGAGALTSAYKAAVDGDIITLSPGTFSSPGTINKSITLRGAGIEADQKTHISGDLTICSTDSLMNIVVEGIRISNTTYVQNNASGTGQGTIKFIKNAFGGLTANAAANYSTEKGPTVRLFNNGIYDMYFDSNSHPDFMFYNCYVQDPYCSSSNFTETTTTFVNCVINWRRDYYGWTETNCRYYRTSETYFLNFFNCIFVWNAPIYNNYCSIQTLPNTATCYNCLSINDNALFNNLVSGGNNKTASNVSNIFVTYANAHNVGETFELTDAAKETYIGTDGTQIGMQGGFYPYNTVVQYPIITTFNTDSQTNKEGILNVEIEVDGK